MKRILIITAVALGCIFMDAFTAHSQTRRGVVTASSTVITRTRIQKEKNPVKIKWQHNIDATVSDFYSATYTGGWRFGNFLFLGFGTGIQVYPRVIPWSDDKTFILTNIDKSHDPEHLKDYNSIDDFMGEGYHNPSRIAVPLYAQMKLRFLKSRVAPYLTASGGLLIQGGCYSDSSTSDWDPYYGTYTYKKFYNDGVAPTGYAEIIVGIDIRLKNESNISLGLGPIWTGQQDGYLTTISDHDLYNRAIGCFKLGYSF